VEHDGQSVGFLARGAAGGPDVDLLLAGLFLALDDLGQGLVAEDVELAGVAEEAGLVGGDQLAEQLELLVLAGADAQELGVVAEAAELQGGDARA
jgi:hypothetical protein